MTYRTPAAKLVEVGIREGFRSGLEEKVADQLRSLGVEVEFEQSKIKYVKPARNSTYTPDFRLPNGIFIETKGRFVTEDRQKHILVKAQHPDIDIRFVFSNSRTRISKTSATTYADWCKKHGFLFADKTIPLDWIKS
ncbi:endodeoxyribonuclease [uncultured Agrobacterium sp.]|uniref:endodeoxyribonuclease n=1 Tax=uncultured Agrobacterium sp. TaxID=157277 RepID=UPI0025F2B0AA|nr:endodeoxyribonuclease [uncultured Agrobacterium sp.]